MTNTNKTLALSVYLTLLISLIIAPLTSLALNHPANTAKQQNKMDSLKERQDNRMDSLKDKQDNRMDSLKERQENRQESLKEKQANNLNRINASSTALASSSNRAPKLKALEGRIDRNDDKFNPRNATSSATTSKNIFDKAIDKSKKLDSKSLTRAANAHLNILVNRLEASIKRLEVLQGNVASRITKLESNGVVLTEAKSLLVSSVTKLDIAKGNIGAIKSKVALMITSTSTRNFDELRSLSSTAETSIASSYASLKLSFVSLKNTFISNKGATATSTATTTATSTR